MKYEPIFSTTFILLVHNVDKDGDRKKIYIFFGLTHMLAHMRSNIFF